jgi:hypothetical protein
MAKPKNLINIEASMDGRRRDDQEQNTNQIHKPIIYYRRFSDKVIILSFLLGALVTCYYLFEGMKEFNIVLSFTVIIFALVLGLVTSKIANAICAQYSHFYKK